MSSVWNCQRKQPTYRNEENVGHVGRKRRSQRKMRETGAFSCLFIKTCGFALPRGYKNTTEKKIRCVHKVYRQLATNISNTFAFRHEFQSLISLNRQIIFKSNTHFRAHFKGIWINIHLVRCNMAQSSNQHPKSFVSVCHNVSVQTGDSFRFVRVRNPNLSHTKSV